MQADSTTRHTTATISLATLTAMVVGSIVGAGVFSLPSRFAGETGVLGALISWLVAGTVVAFGASTACVWLFYLLVRRGVKEATTINRIVTVAKVLPIIAFVLIAVFLLDPQVLVDNFEGYGITGPLFEQVRGTMLATVFVFLGVEGASVYSRHARRREDVGRATVLGFLTVLAIFASVTIVSYGILPMAELAELRQPSMAGVLEAAVGGWGAVFVSVGLIVSVLGAYLAWTLMASEVLYVAAKDGDMPRFLARSDARDVPRSALLLSTLLIQVMLFVTLLSDDAFTFALDLTSALTLIPFLLAAGYALKLAAGRGGPAEGRPTTGELVVAVLAVLYTAFLLFAAGLTFVLLSLVIYAPATILFAMTRREQGRRVFSSGELVVFVVSVVGAVAGVVALATGVISI